MSLLSQRGKSLGAGSRARGPGESFAGCFFAFLTGQSRRRSIQPPGTYLWSGSAPPPPRPAHRRGPEGAREPAGGHSAASPPPLAAEAPPLRAPARPPRAPALALAPSRPRAGGGLAARAGRGSGASRRRERSPRGRLRGLSGRRRLSRRCCSSRGGRAGGGCGRRRATRRPLSSGREVSQVGSPPPGLEERGGKPAGWRSARQWSCDPGETARRAGEGGASPGHPRARGRRGAEPGCARLLMQREPGSRGGGSALGAEGGEGGRSWQRAGEVGRPWQREGNSFQITPRCHPVDGTCPPRSPVMGTVSREEGGCS